MNLRKALPKKAERTEGRSRPQAQVRNSVSLAGALLAVFLRLVEPALQDGKRLGIDFEENHASAKIGLHVNDFGFCLEGLVARENLHQDLRLLGKGIHHIQIATV